MTSNEASIPGVLANRLAAELPAQGAFGWNRVKWGPVVHDVPDAEDALRTLPDRLDRTVVRDVVQGNLTTDRALGALVPVLIWGGPGGFGPFRARKILTGVNTRANIDAVVDDTIRDRLIKGAEAVRRSGPAEGFRVMNNEGKVKHLGGSFFTKWLAFTSMGGAIDGAEVAPILDKRVRDWIAKHTSGPGQIDLSTNSTRDYIRYLELLDSWGKPYERTRTQVELAIFDLTRDRPSEV